VVILSEYESQDMLRVIIQPLGFVIVHISQEGLAWRSGKSIVQITPIKMILVHGLRLEFSHLDFYSRFSEILTT